MASVLISGLIPVLQQPRLMPGMEEERQQLLQLFTAILPVLPHAELRAEREGEEEEEEDKDVKTWLSDLKAAAYKAHDVLDEFRYAMLRAEAKTDRHQCGDKVRTSIFSSCKLINGRRLPFKGGMRERLTGIMITIGELVERSTHFISRQGQVLMSCTEGSQDPTLSSLKEINITIFGREGDKEHIVHQLLDLSHTVGNTITVLQIVGDAGIGKTALTRYVCADTRIMDNFEIIVWVDVRVKFDVARIAKSVIDQVIGKDCCLSEGDTELLGHRFYQELSGKRYLLVLDDVWNGDGEKWEPLKSWLEQSAATGRNGYTSMYNTVPIYKLTELN